MSLISGIAHVNLTVPAGTLPLAQEFYGNTLGFKSVPVPALQRNTLAWYVQLSCAFSPPPISTPLIPPGSTSPPAASRSTSRTPPTATSNTPTPPGTPASSSRRPKRCSSCRSAYGSTTRPRARARRPRRIGRGERVLVGLSFPLRGCIEWIALVEGLVGCCGFSLRGAG
jgi:hypothetical protein